MTYATTMTSKGQVTVPVAIRRKLGFRPGEQITFELKGNTATLKAATDWQTGLAEIQAEIAAHIKKHNIKPLSDEELDVAINEAAQQAATARYQRSLKA
jgi:AbrB family looped-hinge helix DNA binding protein